MQSTKILKMDHAVRRGSVDNLLVVWGKSMPYEIEDGRTYYWKQRDRMTQRSLLTGFDLTSVTGAFCALSPNTSEAMNYLALDACLEIALGHLPENYKVPAYGANKTKALRILRGEPVLDVLKGQKVTSFFHNTINPENNEWVTADGHMLGAWIGRRLVLRREAEIQKDEYPWIVEDFKLAASYVGIPVAGFQAGLWLTWRRLHRILWKPPQLSLWPESFPYAFLDGSQPKAGPLMDAVT